MTALLSTRLSDTPLAYQAASDWLHAGAGDAGAVVLFSGVVRRDAAHHQGLFLEHYPGMSERALQTVAEQVSSRWPTLRVLAWHRVGELMIGETIVFAGVAAAHRAEAFEACCCLMDRLKTEVPLWKKVLHDQGAEWVEARDKDLQAAARWSGTERPDWR